MSDEQESLLWKNLSKQMQWAGIGSVAVMLASAVGVAPRRPFFEGTIPPGVMGYLVVFFIGWLAVGLTLLWVGLRYFREHDLLALFGNEEPSKEYPRMAFCLFFGWALLTFWVGGIWPPLYYASLGGGVLAVVVKYVTRKESAVMVTPQAAPVTEPPKPEPPKVTDDEALARALEVFKKKGG